MTIWPEPAMLDTNLLVYAYSEDALNTSRPFLCLTVPKSLARRYVSAPRCSRSFMR